MQHNALRGHIGDQEPSGHKNPTHQACALVNRSKVAKDTAHRTQRAERAQRRTGAK